MVYAFQPAASAAGASSSHAAQVARPPMVYAFQPAASAAGASSSYAARGCPQAPAVVSSRRCGPSRPDCYKKGPNGALRYPPQSQADCADHCTFVKGSGNRHAICRVGAPASPRTSRTSAGGCSQVSAGGRKKVPKNPECYKVWPDGIHYPPQSQADCAEGCHFVPATDKHGAYCMRGSGCKSKKSATPAAACPASSSRTAARAQAQMQFAPSVQDLVQALCEAQAIEQAQAQTSGRRSRK